MATGTIKQPTHTVVLSGTIGALNTDVLIPFPSGYNLNNCVIVNTEVYSSGIWRNNYYMMAFPASYMVIASLRSNGVDLYPAGSETANKSFRVTLLRVV